MFSTADCCWPLPAQCPICWCGFYRLVAQSVRYLLFLSQLCGQKHWQPCHGNLLSCPCRWQTATALTPTACISKYSGGCIHYFPNFHNVRNPAEAERLEATIRRYLTRKIGFESVMRIRCTRGDAHTHFQPGEPCMHHCFVYEQMA